MTTALFLVAETIVGQAIEPLIYGHSTGLSPVAVITAATFWTWLWGPIGLILATPLTMCLVVLALLWQIITNGKVIGFPNQFFNDSWVVGLWEGRPW